MERELRNVLRSQNPLARLKAVHELRAQADEALDYMEAEAVAAAKSARASWQEIGSAMGLSASAALRRFDPPAKRVKPGEPLFDLPADVHS